MFGAGCQIDLVTILVQWEGGWHGEEELVGQRRWQEERGSREELDLERRWERHKRKRGVEGGGKLS